MRILLVSLYFVEYALELAEAIGKSEQVHLVLSKGRVKATVGYDVLNRLGPNLSFSLLSFTSLKNPTVIRTILEIFGIVRQFKPDVIHLQECFNPLNGVFLFFQTYTIAATVHDVMIHPGVQRQRVPKWKRFFVDMIRKHAYQKVIVHGRALKQKYIESYKRDEADIFVIPHGCLFSYQKQDVNNVTEEPHTILFFGRIQEYKGLRYLIGAEPFVSNAVPDLKIIVAGEGDELTKYKQRMVSNSHYEIHDGFIPNTNVAEYFQRASIIVLPYIEASQSGVVAMAFAFGKPVIVTDVGSLSEMVQDGYSGIVIPPRDALALAEAMISLLSDSRKRRRLARNAHIISQSGASVGKCGQTNC